MCKKILESQGSICHFYIDMCQFYVEHNKDSVKILNIDTNRFKVESNCKTTKKTKETTIDSCFHY